MLEILPARRVFVRFRPALALLFNPSSSSIPASNIFRTLDYNGQWQLSLRARMVIMTLLMRHSHMYAWLETEDTYLWQFPTVTYLRYLFFRPLKEIGVQALECHVETFRYAFFQVRTSNLLLINASMTYIYPQAVLKSGWLSVFETIFVGPLVTTPAFTSSLFHL